MSAFNGVDSEKMKYIDDAFSYHAITLGDWMLLSFQLQVITLAFHVFCHGFSRLPGFLIEIKYGENCMVCVVLAFRGMRGWD